MHVTIYKSVIRDFCTTSKIMYLELRKKIITASRVLIMDNPDKKLRIKPVGNLEIKEIDIQE